MRNLFREAFWCVNYLVTWLDVFSASMFLKGLWSYVSLELPPPKRSTCAQNPTSHRGWFQPGARLSIINTISLPLELKLFNWINYNVWQEFTKQIRKHAFSLRGARNTLKWNKVMKKIYSVYSIVFEPYWTGGTESLQKKLEQ